VTPIFIEHLIGILGCFIRGPAEARHSTYTRYNVIHITGFVEILWDGAVTSYRGIEQKKCSMDKPANFTAAHFVAKCHVRTCSQKSHVYRLYLR